MNGLTKNLLVLALALGLCSCGATVSTTGLDHSNPAPVNTATDSAATSSDAANRGTSSWIGDECGKGKGGGLGGLITGLLGTLTDDNSGSGS